MVLVTIGPSTSRKGFVCFYTLFPMLLMHPPMESKVWLGAAMIFRINNMQKGGFYEGSMQVVSSGMSILCGGFYVITKFIFIHPTTNFYAMLAPKIFVCILTIDSMYPIGHHVP